MPTEILFQIHLVLGYVAWLLCFSAYVWPWLRSMRALPTLPRRISDRHAHVARFLSFRKAAWCLLDTKSDIPSRRTLRAFERADIVPEIVRHRLVSVRAYDADDMCIYALGDVCDGTDVERLLDRALADHHTDYVNIHTARPGCFLCRVERA